MTRTELLKTAKPILFNTEMVQAILDVRKTQTRRVIKYHGKDKKQYPIPTMTKFVGIKHSLFTFESKNDIYSIKPKYQIGDILYVRETWHESGDEYYYKTDTTCRFAGKPGYDNDCEDDDCGIYIACEAANGNLKWKPSIHMPKEAARIFLWVRGIRAERLQDATHYNACCEGVSNIPYCDGDDYIGKFKKQWNKIYSKLDGGIYAWERNPWVWVYDFERIEVE